MIEKQRGSGEAEAIGKVLEQAFADEGGPQRTMALALDRSHRAAAGARGLYLPKQL
jgi:hypothetical protein